ncbi:MAG: amidohydrolase [Desulfobacterales bacterium]|nr:amidohydrolase [Desulfobacterales bacterium]
MIIDTSNTLPTREMLFDDLFSPSEENKLYFRMFATAWAKWLDMSPEEFEAAAERLSDKGVKEELIQRAESGPMSMDNFVKQLKQAGITYSAVHNMDEQNATGSALPNDYVADILNKYPDQFIGFTGFNPHKGKKSLDEAERALTRLGLRAVVFRPFMHRLFANDPKYYPLYALCEDLGAPIWIHTSVNWATNQSIYYGHPKYLEQVLIDFPKLKIIAGHGGWPWIPDIVIMLWKYENLFVDTSAHRPRYVAKPNTGWDMFLHFANSTIQDKILFGSDWVSMGMDIGDVIREVNEWPLKPHVKEKLFWKNALRVFNLEEKSKYISQE